MRNEHRHFHHERISGDGRYSHPQFILWTYWIPSTYSFIPFTSPASSSSPINLSHGVHKLRDARSEAFHDPSFRFSLHHSSSNIPAIRSSRLREDAFSYNPFKDRAVWGCGSQLRFSVTVFHHCEVHCPCLGHEILFSK